MKSLAGVIVCGIVSAYLWSTIKGPATKEEPITAQLKSIYIKDLDPYWPIEASEDIPILLVNNQPLYKAALGYLPNRQSQIARPVSLLKEALKFEIIRQYLLNDPNLSIEEKASMVACNKKSKTWLTDINRSITKVLNRIILHSGQISPTHIDQTVSRQENDSNKVTRDVLVLSMKRNTEQEIEWSLLETKLSAIKKRIDRQHIGFNEALSKYSIIKNPLQARINGLKSPSAGETRLPKPVLEQIFSLSIGEISPPLRFGNQIALVKVVQVVTGKRHISHQKNKATVKKVSEFIIEQKKSIIEKMLGATDIKVRREAALDTSKLVRSVFIKLLLTSDSKI